MLNPVHALLRWLALRLAAVGLVDAQRGRRTVDLAWPRMVTGIARISQRVADFAMIGIVLGPPALAGMAFALAYWQIGNTLSLGLSGGTISQVAQRYGARDDAGVDVAMKQSLWVGLALAAPLTVLFVTVPGPLIEFLGAAPETVTYGAAYLQIAGAALAFEFANKIASRALVGADDAWTPMVIRGTGAVVNIVLNAVFIFGLGMGVVGAALGTVAATVVVTAAFGWGLLAGRLPGVGPFPIRVHLGAPYVDRTTAAQLLTIATPLMGRRLAQTVAVFPLLAIAATFGPVVVAALEVARQVRMLAVTPNWGFSLATSSLVGQHLGRDDEGTATAFGWDAMWLSLVVHAAIAVLVFAFARPIASVFVGEPGALDRTVPFVRMAALSVVGLGIDGVATGALRASGDTRWPFYGKLVGLYVITLPVAYLSVVTPLGVVALYVALLTETATPAVVTFYRFRTGRWLAVSRAFRSSPAD